MEPNIAGESNKNAALSKGMESGPELLHRHACNKLTELGQES